MKSKKETGAIGEGIAARFLEKSGYSIVERNYKRKFGEIDIIAGKGNTLFFVEVKSIKAPLSSVSRENLRDPSEKVDFFKVRKIQKTGEYYLNRKSIDAQAQIIVVVVYIDEELRKAKCKIIENVL